ncbi:MAG: SET domain-containing protein-lysine N-methyltransferase, partial [Gammaproteobacteria bacterium]|nr:SET domain-containing protein-lysine N-methyltransferase [Gammaproteobacteria bacterium]
APCIELDLGDCERLAGTRIDDYYFRHPGNAQHGLLVLGLVSLCNHSDEPNTRTAYAQRTDIGWTVLTIARRPIRAGEELTRRYACPPWFETSD